MTHHGLWCRPLAAVLFALGACASPEAARGRDGGPGGDIGNKHLADGPMGKPVAADTTMWPGRASAPTDRLAAGKMPLPASALPAPPPTSSAVGTTGAATPAGGSAQVTKPTRAVPSETNVYDKGSANPRVPAPRKP
ncbi:MAG: hypothetical protein NVS1B4_02560 [Gemmatimonadaceae bacterium]